MVQLQTKRRIPKPFGLYIITIFDFIAVGLIPLLFVILAWGYRVFELPFWGILIFVVLPVFVMAASVWAAVGNNAGRWLLLALVTLASVLLGMSPLILFFEGELPREGQTAPAAGILICAAFWIGINWWYFTRAHVVAYFKQNK